MALARHDHEREIATRIVKRLRDAGHEAYFVGGCVREILLGGDPEDYDVTTDATPDRVAELFGRVVEVGKQFGVVMVIDEEVVTEVATYRTEGAYSDGRRPDEIRFATAAEDVSRRDFTINALLMDPVTGDVVDHVGGRADLDRRVLRTVGEPRARFDEDRLRLLRAVRFTARLGFELEGATRAACVEMAPRVTSVSPERLRDELSRMLEHPSRGHALRLLDELGLLEHVLPEVHALRDRPQGERCLCARSSAFDHVLGAVARLPPDASLCAAWGTLLHELPHETARDVAKRLRMSNAHAERVATLVRDHGLPRESPGWRLSRVRQALASPALDDLLEVACAEGDGSPETTAGVAFLQEARLRWGTVLPPPLVTGDDLIAAGAARGPELGRMLDALRAEQLEEQIVSREQALARAKELAAGGGAK